MIEGEGETTAPNAFEEKAGCLVRRRTGTNWYFQI
jgi:hypothetical protein